jgi:hypothetical protein
MRNRRGVRDGTGSRKDCPRKDGSGAGKLIRGPRRDGSGPGRGRNSRNKQG